VIKEKQEGGLPHLIVDTGNFAKGRGSANLIKANYLARAMTDMGYDAVNLAREEIMLGSQQIMELKDRERLPLVSSNLYRREGKRHLVTPYVIKRVDSSRFLGFEYGGLKVALVGLTGEELRDHMGRVVPAELYLEESQKALSTTLEKLRRHCDVVIVLSDLDLAQARQLAQEVAGIDLFFIGRGAKAKHVEKIGQTIFVYPAAKGDELGDIVLVVDEHGEVTSHQVEWTLLDDKVADNPEMNQLLADYKEALKVLRSLPPRSDK
jgi:2',3'-cyclic-nucleotide 2'-phosphodiesterase (5'-nucleotidase family)